MRPKTQSTPPLCLVCNLKQPKQFIYRSYTYYRCPRCGLVTTLPLPSPTTITKHYQKKFSQGNYQLLRRYAPQYLSVYRAMAKQLAIYCQTRQVTLKNAKLLDVGTFTGEFLEAVSDYGCQVWGVELQPEAVKLANQKFPGKIIQADVMSGQFPHQQFDVITLLGLIEHVTDPLKLLAKVSKLLTPKGIMMIQTPDSHSYLARFMGKWWPPYSPVEHIHLFSRKSLELTLLNLNYQHFYFKRHIKSLPINYVYQNLQNFGPEFYSLIKPLAPLMAKSRLTLPFYGGEIMLFAQKSPR